jgi:hypothetical protein
VSPGKIITMLYPYVVVREDRELPEGLRSGWWPALVDDGERNDAAFREIMRFRRVPAWRGPRDESEVDSLLCEGAAPITQAGA